MVSEKWVRLSCDSGLEALRPSERNESAKLEDDSIGASWCEWDDDE